MGLGSNDIQENGYKRSFCMLRNEKTRSRQIS